MAIYQVETDNGTYEIETEDTAAQGFTAGGAKQPIPADVYNEAGVQDVSMTPITKPDLEQAGEDIATSPFGQRNPMTGAALGTAVAKADDIAAAVSGIRAAPAMAQGIEALGTAAKGGLKGITEGMLKPFRSTVEAFKGPSQAEATALGKEMRLNFHPEETIEKAKLVGQQIVSPEQAKVVYMEQQLKGMPAKNAEKMAELETLRKEAGAGMEAAEKAGGFHVTPDAGFERVAGSKESMGDVLDVMGKWANMDPKEIANTVDAPTINMFRKLSKAGQEQLSDVGRISMQKGESAASEALGFISEKFKSSKDQYRTVMQAIKDLEATQPLQAKQLQREIVYLKVGVEKAEQEAANLMQAARTANAAQRTEINQRALELLKKGVQHDKLMSKIKIAAGVVGAGTAYGLAQ